MTDDAAYAPFLKLLEAEPDDPMLLYGIGRKYLEDGRAAEALPHLRRCVEVDPGYSAARRELGRALEATGATAEAAAVFRDGIPVAEAKGDLQTAKEMRVFLARLEAE